MKKLFILMLAVFILSYVFVFTGCELFFPLPTYTVFYHGNGNTGGEIPTLGRNAFIGATFTVDGNDGLLVKSGFDFAGWNSEIDGNGSALVEGDTFQMPAANITLYAQWTPKVYAVGDTGPAGGLVFYIDSTDKFPGWTYLEAAPVSKNSTGIDWGGYNSPAVGGTRREIGTGKANTDRIIAAFGDFESYNHNYNYAAKWATDLYCVYEDWFLPSCDELSELAKVVDQYDIPGYYSQYYLSSTEYNATSARVVNILTGAITDSDKFLNSYVLAIRSF